MVGKSNNQITEGLITQKELYKILPFGKTKIKQIIKSGCMPAVKLGKDYLTSYPLIEKWIEKHAGEEIYF